MRCLGQPVMEQELCLLCCPFVVSQAAPEISIYDYLLEFHHINFGPIITLIKFDFKLFQHYKYNKFIEDVEFNG